MIDKQLSEILNKLADQDPYQKTKGTVELAKLDGVPSSTVPMLIDAFQNDDIFVKQWCAIAFGRISLDAISASPVLLRELKNLQANSKELLFDMSFLQLKHVFVL